MKNIDYLHRSLTYKLDNSSQYDLVILDGDNFERLMKHADIALYTAKTNGKNRSVLFDAKNG